MGNTQTVEKNEYAPYKDVKHICQRRIEGYGKTDQEALEDLNRKCIKKGYDGITRTSNGFYCGKIELYGVRYYNEVWFKTRKNIAVAYVFVNF